MSVPECNKRATAKWQKNNYKRIQLNVFFRHADLLKMYADKSGESVSMFMKKAIAERVQREFPDEQQFPWI